MKTRLLYHVFATYGLGKTCVAEEVQHGVQERRDPSVRIRQDANIAIHKTTSNENYHMQFRLPTSIATTSLQDAQSVEFGHDIAFA